MERSNDRLAPITDRDEISHYDDAADTEANFRSLLSKATAAQQLGTAWSVPVVRWLDSIHDAAAQADVYVHLSSNVAGGHVLQVGGSGQAAIKALIGGAQQATLVTPSRGEAQLATRVADQLGLLDRFEASVGFAEKLPVEAGTVTAVISEACLHHTNVSVALNEGRRVLVEGGKFGAWDPWKARLYELGIAVFGKRDPDVNCRPMDSARVEALPQVFPNHSEVRLHGALTRYAGVVWSRYIREPTVATSYRVTRVDDAISRHFRALARNGSSVAILATK